MQQPNSILSVSPSFSSYSSHQFADIADKVIREMKLEDEEEQVEEEEEEEDQNPNMVMMPTISESEDDDEGGFEFTFLREDPNAAPLTADEIFSNGQIRPIFPIFNRDLLLEEHGDDSRQEDRNRPIRLPLRKLLIESRAEPPAFSTSSSASSESENLDGIPDGTYCVWTPGSTPPATPDRCKKSNSTGSSKRWRFRDLLPRSSSDGKDHPQTYVFISTDAIKRGEKEVKGLLKDKTKASASASPSPSRSSGRGKALSAHEMHYVKSRAMREGDRHRSYLPYRKDIVGFFANVNGLSKTHHPF